VAEEPEPQRLQARMPLPSPELAQARMPLPSPELAPARPPEQEPAMQPVCPKAPVPQRFDLQERSPEPLPARAFRCWPAGFASCNHRQTAGLPGRVEGATEKSD
jgi:hypothetical protein